MHYFVCETTANIKMGSLPSKTKGPKVGYWTVYRSEPAMRDLCESVYARVFVWYAEIFKPHYLAVKNRIKPFLHVCMRTGCTYAACIKVLSFCLCSSVDHVCTKGVIECVCVVKTCLALLLGGLQTGNHSSFSSSGLGGKLPWVLKSTSLNSFCSLSISIQIIGVLISIFPLSY